MELKAVILALQHFSKQCTKKQVVITSDTTTVVAQINKQGGTHSTKLCALMWRLLTWCNKHQITLRAKHVPGSLNVIADGLSRRNQIQHTEWSLSPQIFKQITVLWERPQIDLFATNLNTNSHSRSTGLDGGCTEHFLEEHNRLCFSSNITTAKSGSEIIVPRMQVHPDSPRLANKTVVLGSGGTVSQPSKTTSTNLLATQTTTEQPIAHSPRIPQPPRMVSRSTTLQNQGFTAEVADRIAAPQRYSTRAIYASKWSVF